MTRLYEAMFLVDNEAVRAGWREAKSAVTDLIGKHGGAVHTARRWDERKLAYPVKGRRRATYLFTYCDIDAREMPSLVRDLDLNEVVLRYLMLRAEAVPDGERELAAKEDAEDFVVPEPPADDHDEGPRAAVPEEAEATPAPKAPEGEAPAPADGEPAAEATEATEESPQPALAKAGDEAKED